MSKEFAQVFKNQSEPKQVGDYLYSFERQYARAYVESWDNFVLDTLYKAYQEQGVTDLIAVSREDFERFLLWALPRYREEVLEMTSKKALEEIKDFITKNQTDIRILDLLSLIEKDLEILGILKQNLTINKNYNGQCSGSTKAIVLCIPDCVSIDEDDEYTDDCCPNPEYDKIEKWLENE